MTTGFCNLFPVVSSFFVVFRRTSEFDRAGIFVPGNLVTKPSYPVCNYSVLCGLTQMGMGIAEGTRVFDKSDKE